MRAFRCNASFRDIGTPADYLATSLELAGTNLATLAGRGCEISPDSRVSRSILWEDVIVDAGATVERSIVAAGSRIAPGARLEGVIALPAAVGAPLVPGPARTVGDLLVLPIESRWS